VVAHRICDPEDTYLLRPRAAKDVM